MISKAPEPLSQKLPLAIASFCLGRAKVHELEPKLEAAAAAGYKGIELFYEDIKIPAERLTDSKNDKHAFQKNLFDAETRFKQLCDKHGQEIFVLQPIKNYEGLLSRDKHARKIEKLKMWFKLAKVLGTDMIQIPTNFWSDNTTGEMDVIVSDLQEEADLGAAEQPPIRFAYEIMAGGAHVNTWQKQWEVIEKVDRDNLGMCLDTYQILAKLWADCTSKSGIKPDADRILEEDLQELKRTVPLDKVYYVQLADAEKLSPPMGPGHPWYDPKMQPTMSWSRNARLFPFEEDRGGYLPVLRMFEFWVFDYGYRGWVSMEVFNRSMFEPGEEVPKEHAVRGVQSWRKCVKALGLDDKTE